MARKPKTSSADAVAERLTAKTPRVPPIPPEDFLSTGSTLINLALTGHPHRGVPKGTFLYLVGDSGAMKTWVSLTVFAEAVRNKNFAKHRLVYDAPENGALMDVPRFFGDETARRIVPPCGSRSEPVCSGTVQELYFNIDDTLDRGPCIYVLDSMDGLNADEDDEKFEEDKKAFRAGKEVKGTYGIAKAKVNSKNINRVIQRLRKTGSILIVISQTRDRIGGSIPGLRTRGGGRALKFYAHAELWTSVKFPLVRTYMGREREYGSMIVVDVQKNRLSGWEGKIQVPFIKGVGSSVAGGIDDTGGLVSFLIEERHWMATQKGGALVAPEFDFTGLAEGLVQKIEADGDEYELQLLAAKVWKEIVEGAAPKRKARYV